jgi:hypothetical protein
MKVKKLFLLIIVLLVFNGLVKGQEDFPLLRGSYLGQKPPGKKAEIFAPGIVCTEEYHDYHSDYLITDKFFIFKRSGSGMGSTVWVTWLKDGQWTRLQKTSHPGKPWYLNYPFAETGQIIYFSWRGSLGNVSSSYDLNLWLVKKTQNGWSQPDKLKAPVNTSSHDTWPGVTSDRTVYFFSGREGGYGKSDIYRTPFENGSHARVENLGDIINTKYSEVDPFVAGDESYLIFCSNKPGGMGKLDMYVAFRCANGSWRQPVNMGVAVNSSGNEERPYVTPDGKYFFFTSNRRGKLDIYWINVQVIQELEPKTLK